MHLRLRHTPWALLTLTLACATPQQATTPTAPPPPPPHPPKPPPPTKTQGNHLVPHTEQRVEKLEKQPPGLKSAL